MERPRTAVEIRLAEAHELAAAIEVERRSSVRFAEVEGLEHWVDDTTELSELLPALEHGMVWVAVVDGAPVGWCYASEVDDSLFVEQIDVLPEYGRRGIGGGLLDTVSAEADRRGLSAVTLTTDAHVPWNRPWYEQVGFTVVPTGRQGPGLATAVADEARRGLDLSRRVAMRREITPTHPVL